MTPPRYTTITAAVWLSKHVPAIACHEDAGQLFTQVRKAVDDIEHLINRPIPPRILGPCPHLIEHHKACAVQLSAKRSADQVTCPSCETTWLVKDLIENMRNELAYYPMTVVEFMGRRTSELPGVLEELGLKVNRRMFYRWCKSGLLPARAYRSRSGSISGQRQSDGDEPMYWLADVRKLLEKTAEEAS